MYLSDKLHGQSLFFVLINKKNQVFYRREVFG